MLLTVAISDYLAERAPYLSAKTLRWYQDKLDMFAQWGTESSRILLTEDFSAHVVVEFLRYLMQTSSRQYQQPRSSYTLHGYSQVLKQFAGWLDENEMTQKPAQAGIKHPRVDVKVIQTFTADQIKRLLIAAATQPNKRLAARDQAILSMLVDTGIRAAELCSLELRCVHLDVSDSYIQVYGKGRKEREISRGVRSRPLLAAYIHRWRPEDTDLPWVFLNAEFDRLTPDGLFQLIERMRDRVGGPPAFPGIRVSPHTFRHTFAIRQLEAGTDIFRLSRILGHSSITTTQGYLRAFQSRDARRSVTSVLDHLRN